MSNPYTVDEETKRRAQETLAALKRMSEGVAAGTISDADAAKQAQALGGMSGTQAAENVAGIKENRDAVNTASPTGLFTGTLSGTPGDNIAKAPTAVIASTATDAEKTAAAAAAQKALARVQTPGKAPTITTDTDPAPAKPPVAASTSTSPASTAQTMPQFQYKPSTRGDEQLLAEARARAALLIGTQREQTQGNFAKAQELAQQQIQALNRRQAGNMETNRTTWAGRNLGTSGFLAGANALGQAAATQEQGQIGAEQRLALDQTNAELARLSTLQGQSEIANYDQLIAAERSYGLQDRGQQFSEYTGQANLGMQQQSLASQLALNALNLRRGESLLPGEIAGQGLANQQAQFNLNRGQQLLPGEIAGQGLSNDQAQFNLDRGRTLLPGEEYGQQLGNAQAGWNLSTAKDMYPLQKTAAELQNSRNTLANQAAQLEYDVANSKDVGLRAQKQAELDKAKKDLAYTDAQIASLNRNGTNGGLTPYQQYEIDRNAKSDAQKVRAEAVQNYAKEYKVGTKAADVWTTVEDLSSTPKADGSMPTYQDLYPVLSQMLQTAGLSGADQAWLNVIFQASQGNTEAQQNLAKYRRDYDK